MPPHDQALQLLLYIILLGAFILLLIPAPAFANTIMLGHRITRMSGESREDAIRTHRHRFANIFISFASAVILIECIEMFFRIRKLYHVPHIFWLHSLPAVTLLVLLILTTWNNGLTLPRAMHRVIAYAMVGCYLLSFALGVPLVFDMWGTIGKV